MTNNRDDARLRAEAKFRKKEREAEEREKVWAEQAAATNAADDKRARLKSLRLAKEAADRDAEAGKAAQKPAKKPRKR
jgi:hypothetical protein